MENPPDAGVYRLATIRKQEKCRDRLYRRAITNGLKYRNMDKPKEISKRLERACLISSHYLCAAFPSAYTHAKHIKKGTPAQVFRKYQNYISLSDVREAVVTKYKARGKMNNAHWFERLKDEKLMEELAPFVSKFPEIEEKYALVYSFVRDPDRPHDYKYQTNSLDGGDVS
ncbi:hypothetical protein RCL_jg10364.t1 [Rhizophagus clarus]|uniref:Uncharacterized protein n=1 Tax=Rhizophagus clarus TaxID=94130 RepID=A0A8H3KV39_9GLOM|nr:hypothetical protein RCL_jg10364.t1 [Rhizophagus clarus]